MGGRRGLALNLLPGCHPSHQWVISPALSFENFKALDKCLPAKCFWLTSAPKQLPGAPNGSESVLVISITGRETYSLPLGEGGGACFWVHLLSLLRREGVWNIKTEMQASAALTPVSPCPILSHMRGAIHQPDRHTHPLYMSGCFI